MTDLSPPDKLPGSTSVSFLTPSEYKVLTAVQRLGGLPATVLDVRQLTRLKPREFRRALLHLERVGLVARRRDDRGATVWEAKS